MKGWLRRVAYAVVIVASTTLVYAVAFWWGMAVFEDRRVSFVQSLQVVVESLTTAGYGGFAPWESAVMNLLVLAMNVTGVLMVFVGLPLFALPLFRKAFARELPTSSNLTDHVLICNYSERDEVLRGELESVEIPYLYVDGDEELVEDLVDDGVPAIHGEPGKLETLESANLHRARALVADADDETNPTIILSAKRLNPGLPVVSVARYEEAARYHEYAGADEVVTSRRVLGESLAMRAATTLAEELREAIEVDTPLEMTEVLVEADTRIAGERLGDIEMFQEEGVNVVAGWFGGKFVVAPGPDTVLEEHSIILLAGDHSELAGLEARKLPSHLGDSPRVVVCGYGTVGKVVTRELRERGVEVEVVDAVDKPGVDVVGDITDPATLEEADVASARSVVFSIDVDTPTIYATIVVNELAPDVEVVARADSSDNVWKLYNAGADYVLSLPTVTGELLASLLIDEKEILTARSEFDFFRTEAPGISGRSLAETDLRQRTGATVVAVERSGELITELRGDFVVEEGDVLVVAGGEDQFERLVEVVEGGGEDGR